MTIWFEDDRITVHHGLAEEILPTLADSSVDSIVCDPPAGISFMGKGWDGDKGGREQWCAWFADIMREALRVVKPGGHALVWALPRTAHWTACGLEDAGWEIRDRCTHVFATGFPKGQNISKAIDKAAGAASAAPSLVLPTAPATDAAKQWDGWNTALKPAAEDWWLVRKPLSEKTIAANVVEHGTGGLNVDACRIGTQVMTESRMTQSEGGVYNANGRDVRHGNWSGRSNERPATSTGRWPTNFVMSHGGLSDGTDACADGCVAGCPVVEMDDQSGQLTSGVPGIKRKGNDSPTYGAESRPPGTQMPGYGDSGGASRFFAVFRYQAKASTRERPKVDGIAHATVKSLALMQWLIRLITPPNGVVLDWCAGSGATGEAALLGGFRSILIEAEADYMPLIGERVARFIEARVDENLRITHQI